MGGDVRTPGVGLGHLSMGGGGGGVKTKVNGLPYFY